MFYLRNKNTHGIILFVTCFISLNALAAEGDAPLSPQDQSTEAFNKTITVETPRPAKQLSTELPSKANVPQMSKEESKVYLKNHPEEFEALLSKLLVQGNADALEELLPLYKQVPNYDPSVIDWGNAIIAAKNGKLDEAVELYRKINAQLPKVDILRFQMAMALFYNRQYNAAQTEFEKLRSGTSAQGDIEVINKYLEAIHKQDSWDFNASLSYLDDSNITNSPKQGTKINNGDNSSLTFSTPREEGRGVNYYISGDKNWHFDNKMFTALHLNSYGKYYWDNKNYNDITASIGTGFGYENATTNVELGPFFNKRWYAQGRNGDGDLHDYADTVGLKLNLSQWLSPQIRYYGLLRYSDTSYIDRYDYNDGNDWLLANTAIYFPNGQQFWSLGVDYSKKDAEDDSSAFERSGLRVGWGQTWPKGYSTKVDLGYAQRDYEAEDFSGIKRENKEYSAGLSFWKRDFSFLGLTPRLQLDYYKVNSNSPFEEYDKTNVSVELTKSF